MKQARKYTQMLGISASLGEYLQPSVRYCNLNKMEFEPDSKLPARQKLWAWLTKCLQGTQSQPGPYYYLIHQCMTHDVSHLFKRLVEVIEVVTICSLDDEVYNVTHLEFNPDVQDLFGYMEDLRRAMRRLKDLNDRLPEEGRVLFSETYLRSRLVRAARQVAIYKPVIDSIISLPVDKWSVISVEQLCTQLESAKANDASLFARRGQSSAPQALDENVAVNFVAAKKEQTTTRNKNMQRICK